MAASTVRDITYTLHDIYEADPPTPATVLVQLRKDGAKFWARAIPSHVNPGGSSTVGTLKLQVRQRVLSGGVWLSWESWKTKKDRKITGLSTQWTDESYTPPKSTSTVRYQVRAALTASPQAGQSPTQGTSGYDN